ncbi:XRE family transcriptional regulator [bacterium]|nr:MAG: XRE family transcriptional regulator [bacterium]
MTIHARMQVEAVRKVGEVIRRRRVAVGHGQVAFFERADIDRQYLLRFERGQRNPPLPLVMSKALELDATLVESLRDVRLDAAKLRAIKRPSRGPRPVGDAGGPGGPGGPGDAE